MSSPKPTSPLVFVCPANFPITTEVTQLIQSEGGSIRGVEKARSVPDAITATATHGRAVLVITAASPKHLKIVTTLTTRLRPRIREGLVKVIIISSLHHDDLPKFLKKHGCEELVPPNAKAKGLLLKLQRHHASVEKAWTQAERSTAKLYDDSADKAGARKGAATAGAATKGGDKASSEKARVTAAPPLDIPDDYWLVRGKKSFKRVQGMWIIELVGPSTDVGSWIKVASKADTWQWALKNPGKGPFTLQGTWTFHGRQPENRGNCWKFIGPEPRMTYSQEGKELYRRFEGTTLELKVARNSKTALARETQIVASYNKDMRIATPQGAEVAGTQESVDSAFDFDTDKGPPAAADPGDEFAPPFLDGNFGTKTSVDPERLAFYEELLSELGPRTEMFQVVTAVESCKKLMREAAHLAAPTTVWTRGQRYRGDTQVSGYDAKTGSLGIHLPAGFDWKSFNHMLGEFKAEEIFINVNCGRTALFFRQSIASVKSKGSSFEVGCPDKVYEVQRRKDLRHHFKRDEQFETTVTLLNGSTAFWKMHDLSAGGAGVSRALELGKTNDPIALLKRGDRVRNILFQVYGREIRCAASIAWVKRTTHLTEEGPREKVHLGLQFENLDPADREGIRLFVMEENFQYLSTGMARLD